jgi:WhiB family redox-sensing transcriptional regulator
VELAEACRRDRVLDPRIAEHPSSPRAAMLEHPRAWRARDRAVTVEGRRGWRSEARCRSVNVETFFPRPGDTFGQQVARAICRRCPVRVECAEYVLELLERSETVVGIWAGVNLGDARQRRQLRRRVTPVSQAPSILADSQ